MFSRTILHLYFFNVKNNAFCPLSPNLLGAAMLMETPLAEDHDENFLLE